MNGKIKIMLIREGDKKPLKHEQLVEEGLVACGFLKNELPNFFDMYFSKSRDWIYEVIYVDNSQEATKKINESDRLDIIVVPAEYQHELLDSIIRFHPVAKVILVHDRRLNMEQESSYWIGDILTLLTWTNYQDFEQLMNQNPVR